MKKWEFPRTDDCALDAFGRKLFGITSEKWHRNVLKGIVGVCNGASAEDILEGARDYMKQDFGADKGWSRRKGLQSYLKDRFESKNQ